MRRLINILWGFWMFFNLWLILFVLSGEYRKVTVFLFLLLENLYHGEMKFSSVVMMCESGFLALFGIYIVLLFVYFAYLFKKKITFFYTCKWGLVWIYFLYYGMFMQLYN